MKFTKINIAVSLVVCSLFAHNTYSKMVEFTEDAYSMQAPQEIVDIAEKAAEFFECKDAYEVVVPKKAGILINPWNKFIGTGINPQTKNHFIVINPEWFLSIPEKQQLFLLGRNFLAIKHGTTPLSMKIIPFLFILFTGCFVLFIVWILGKTRLAEYKPWVKGLIAFCIMTTCNIAFMNGLQSKFLLHVAKNHDKAINEMIIQKTGDKDSAIKALEFFDSSIKSELNNGESFWAPYAMLFENYAHELKK